MREFEANPLEARRRLLADESIWTVVSGCFYRRTVASRQIKLQSIGRKCSRMPRLDSHLIRAIRVPTAFQADRPRLTQCRVGARFGIPPHHKFLMLWASLKHQHNSAAASSAERFSIQYTAERARVVDACSAPRIYMAASGGSSSPGSCLDGRRCARAAAQGKSNRSPNAGQFSPRVVGADCTRRRFTIAGAIASRSSTKSTAPDSIAALGMPDSTQLRGL